MAVIAATSANLRESLGEQLRGWGVENRVTATVPELFRELQHGSRTAPIPVGPRYLPKTTSGRLAMRSGTFEGATS